MSESFVRFFEGKVREKKGVYCVENHIHGFQSSDDIERKEKGVKTRAMAGQRKQKFSLRK